MCENMRLKDVKKLDCEYLFKDVASQEKRVQIATASGSSSISSSCCCCKQASI